MEATYSISTFIKSNTADGSNALIYLRITVNGERAEISIKRTIDRERWDAAANRVRGNKEDARQINTLMDNTILNVRDVFVFCCYTGLSYVDVEKLTKHQIVKGLDGED